MRRGRDAYEVLQVHRRAEPDVIEAAFRRLARKYHSDVSGMDDGGRRMRELNAAYEVLRDPLRRAAYDRDLQAQEDDDDLDEDYDLAVEEEYDEPGTALGLACRQHPSIAAVGPCQDCGAGLCSPCFERFQPATCPGCMLAWAESRRVQLVLPLI